MPFLSTSVLRRYTPPTCTLEIVAQDSPLSRWAGRSLLRKLRFHLSFDDPRLPDAQQVSLRGDRFQLDELCEAVSAYVQNFLNQSPGLISPGSRSSVATLEAPTAAPPAIDLSAARAARTAALSVVEPEPDALLIDQSGELASAAEAAAPPTPLVLESPRIYLQPQGLLAHRLHLGSLATESSSVITLSAIQLADLATALDDYAADAVVLPELNERSWVPTLPAWAPTAAAVLLTAGVTAGVIKTLDQPTPGLKTAVSLSNPQAAGQQAMVPGQVATGPLGVPAPPQTVPPPPPAGAIQSDIPTVPVPNTSAPNAVALAPVPPPPAGANSTAAPPTTNKPIASIPVESAPVALAPRFESAPQLEETAPASEPLPPAPTAAKLPELESARSAAASGEGAEGVSASLEAAQAPTADAASGSAFDSIPQVAEVRSYFEERWQPPEGLTQTLEYTLLIGADGSIQRIVPLGQSAGDYIDRTGMPLVGEPFVTPIQGGKSPRVRVVLSPDGQVRTFLESG